VRNKANGGRVKSEGPSVKQGLRLHFLAETGNFCHPERSLAEIERGVVCGARCLDCASLHSTWQL